MKKGLSLLSLFLVVPLTSCGGSSKKNHIDKIESKQVTCYMLEDVSKTLNLNIYKINGNEAIPYVNVEEAFDHWADLYLLVGAAINPKKEDYAAKIKWDGNTLIASRTIKFSYYEYTGNISFDFDKNIIIKDKGDVMDSVPEMHCPYDIGNATWYDNDEHKFDFLAAGYATYCAAEPITIELDQYNIQMFVDDNKGYLPLQTFFDVFAYNFYVAPLYNGKNIVYASNTAQLYTVDSDYSVKPPKPIYTYTELGKKYYLDHEEGLKKTKELLEFSYNELCLALDLHYGLKEGHGITSTMDKYLRGNNLYERLTSLEPEVEEIAYDELMHFYFGDSHSSYNGKSYLTDECYPTEPNYRFGHASMSTILKTNDFVLLSMEREKTDIKPGYSEIGDTAFITFDSFIGMNNDDFKVHKDYYTNKDKIANYISGNNIDVNCLLIYANQQIKRKDSPIKNVVFDLSLNIGGRSDIAAAVMASLGQEPSEICIKNPVTHEQGVVQYAIDLNLDGNYDENNDTFHNYRLFCVESRVSFSCGNLVPTLMKYSNKVGIIGQQSGGGSCVVRQLSSADGQFFQISGAKQICYDRNNNYVSVEEGAIPDYPILKDEDFYKNNRETVLKIVHDSY